MEKLFQRVKNYNVSVKEVDNQVIFLRKLERGGSEHSFGIHVAKIAGMVPSVVRRAEQVLTELERNNQGESIQRPKVEQISAPDPKSQLSFFQLDDPILTQVRDEIIHTDVDNLTPLEALNKLNDIKKILVLIPPVFEPFKTQKLISLWLQKQKTLKVTRKSKSKNS